MTSNTEHGASATDNEGGTGPANKAPSNNQFRSIVALLARDPVTTAGVVVAGLMFVFVLALQHDFSTALIWALLSGALVVGADPKWCLRAAVLLLLLPPLLILLNATPTAESVARTAFYLLASGIALELREGWAG